MSESAPASGEREEPRAVANPWNARIDERPDPAIQLYREVVGPEVRDSVCSGVRVLLTAAPFALTSL